jgi:hypothetical protein
VPFGSGYPAWVFLGVCVIVLSWTVVPAARRRMLQEIRDPRWRSFQFFLCCCLSLMSIPALKFSGVSSLIVWDYTEFAFYVIFTVIFLTCWRAGARRAMFYFIDGMLFIALPFIGVIAHWSLRLLPVTSK